MTVQFISTNKNYKRLFNAPLDPSIVQETYEEMLEYLNNPTCYVDQIIGCKGVVYIVYEVDGVKKIKKAAGGGFYTGVTPPEDTDLVWVDTTDDNIDNTVDSSIISEFRSILSTMQNKINKLEADVEYLKLNGGGIISPVDPGTDSSYSIICEDEDILITEDGDYIVLEEYQEVITIDSILTESNENFITEDDFNIILEEEII